MLSSEPQLLDLRFQVEGKGWIVLHKDNCLVVQFTVLPFLESASLIVLDTSFLTPFIT